MKWISAIIGIIMIIITVVTTIVIFRVFHLEDRHSHITNSVNNSGY